MHLNMHSVAPMLQIMLPMLHGFVSVPWNPFLCGKIELRIEPAGEGGREGYGRRFTAQTSKGKPSLFSLGNGVAKRSGTEVPEILIVLYSHFHFSHAALQFTKLSNLHFSFDSL